MASSSQSSNPSACFHRVYGLTLSCTSALPGLPVLRAPLSPPDVEVFVQELPEELAHVDDSAGELWWTSDWRDAAGRPLRTIHKMAAGRFFRIRYDFDMTVVVDRDGRRMWLAWPPGVSIDDIAISLLGPLFGLFLRLRGMVCLHASAVRIGEVAVAFVGEPEAGKSTTAAALSRRGHLVLSDDLVTLDLSGGEYLVHPGYPHLRLCPDAAAALYGHADALPRLVSTWEKRSLDLAAARVL